MSHLQAGETTNTLLLRLAPADRDRVMLGAEPVHFENGHSLYRPGEPIAFVYFPESGFASITSHDDPVKIEIGLIGREGFVGLPVLLETDSSPAATFVQMSGRFLRIPVDAFRRMLDESRDIRDLLLLFAQTYLVQISSTAVANASFNVEQRLARWLLMVHDRSGGNDLALTHDFMAVMLGVRRPGVTVATHVLEGERAIRATRGRIEIVDRARLKAFAGRSYGLAEAEYVRLLGERLEGG